MNRIALALVALGASLASPVLAQSAGAPGGAPPTAPVASMNATRPAAPMAHPEGTAGTKMMAPVNINTASAAQLDAIPQIGPKRAQSIIAHRPYSSAEELVSRKAIGQGVFNKIKSHVTTS